jgi:hypothetical protein
MKSFIKKLLREQMIDGQDMNQATQTICNTMTISGYEEALSLVKQSLEGTTPKKRNEIMHKIYTPLENLKHEEASINKQISSINMSGDSVPDEANTYWHQIQSTICEQGPDFE